MTKECLVCGSTETEVRESKRQIPIAYGDPVEIMDQGLLCHSCGEETDASDPALLANALQEAKKTSIGHMLDWLVDDGHSMAFIERALGLPARTLARWKAAGGSAAAIALLRTIRTYPWLLYVAEKRYERRVASGALVAAAAKELLGACRDAPDFHASVTAHKTDEDLCLTYSVETSKSLDDYDWLSARPKILQEAMGVE